MTEVFVFIAVLVTSVPVLFLTLVFDHVKTQRLEQQAQAFHAACRLQAAKINQQGREARGEI